MVVLVAQTPKVAHGCVAIADMGCSLRFANAFCGARLGADDEVIAGKVKPVQRPRHERQVILIERFGERQFLNEGGVDVHPAEGLRHRLWIVDMCEQIGVRKELSQFCQYLFAAAVADEPVMDNCCFHYLFKTSLKTEKYPSTVCSQL